MHEAVLIIGGGPLPTYMVKEAQTMGLKALVVDGNPAAPSAAIADAFYPVDAYDAEAVAALMPCLQQTYHLRGVATAGCDAAPTIALCAERAGVPGLPYDVALRTHNKLAVRLRLTREGLSQCQPEYGEYMRYEDTDTWDTFPCVVKPLSQRASRGVSLVPTRVGLRRAIQHALVYGEEYLIEACLVGTEHSAEIIFTADGNVYWFNIVDRMFDYTSGTGIEVGHVNPTRLPEKTQGAIYQMVLKAALALGVHWGPFKVDVMLTAQGPQILECTARLSGGFDSQRTSPLTGRHPMRLALQVACGMRPEMPPPCAQGYAACAAILPSKTGKVPCLPARPTEDCEIVWCVQGGDILPPLAHNGLRPGFVITHAPTYEAAWAFAKHDADLLADALDAVLLPA